MRLLVPNEHRELVCSVVVGVVSGRYQGYPHLLPCSVSGAFPS